MRVTATMKIVATGRYIHYWCKKKLSLIFNNLIFFFFKYIIFLCIVLIWWNFVVFVYAALQLRRNCTANNKLEFATKVQYVWWSLAIMNKLATLKYKIVAKKK
jgi:hypothetical protein